MKYLFFNSYWNNIWKKNLNMVDKMKKRIVYVVNDIWFFYMELIKCLLNLLLKIFLENILWRGKLNSLDWEYGMI